MKNIGIVGFGWLAQKFAAQCKNDFTFYPTTTHREKYENLLSEGLRPTLVKFEETKEKVKVWEQLPNLDTIVISVPFSTKRDSANSIYNKAHQLLQFIEGFEGQIILFSSVGVYPKEDRTFSEKDLDPLTVITEKYFKEKFPAINILRLGGLMGDDRYFSKYSITKELDSCVNHIHYLDIMKLLRILITQNINSEVLNVVAPEHPTKRQVLAYQKNKMLIEGVVENCRMISSEKLILDYDFKFEYPNPLYF